MELIIKTRLQLESVLYTTIVENNNCTIKLHSHEGYEIIFISNKISEDKIHLCICGDTDSAGKIIKKNDGKRIIEWIKEQCRYVFYDGDEITVEVPDNQQNKINNRNSNFKDRYLSRHIKIKKSDNIKKMNKNSDAGKIFELFLDDDNYDKLIFSFKTNVPNISHMFNIELIVDKIYIYNRVYMSFTIAIPDLNMGIKHHLDLTEEYFDKEDKVKLFEDFITRYLECYRSCALVSDEEIDVNLYSNCKIKDMEG